MFKITFTLPSVMQAGGIFMATASLLSSVILTAKIPEGALFLLVVGCSWLWLAQVAASFNEESPGSLNEK